MPRGGERPYMEVRIPVVIVASSKTEESLALGSLHGLMCVLLRLRKPADCEVCLALSL